MNAQATPPQGPAKCVGLSGRTKPCYSAVSASKGVFSSPFGRRRRPHPHRSAATLLIRLFSDSRAVMQYEISRDDGVTIEELGECARVGAQRRPCQPAPSASPRMTTSVSLYQRCDIEDVIMPLAGDSEFSPKGLCPAAMSSASHLPSSALDYRLESINSFHSRTSRGGHADMQQVVPMPCL